MSSSIALILIFETVSLPEITSWARLVGWPSSPRDPAVSTSQYWNENSGPNACVAGTLPIEPF